MSTILDALRKAKEAPPKEAAAEPRREILSARTHNYLATVGPSADEDRVRLLRWLVAGVVAVAVLLAALLTVVLMHGGAIRNPRPAMRAEGVPEGTDPGAGALLAPVTPAPSPVAAAPTVAAPTPAALAAASVAQAPTTRSPAAEGRLVVGAGTPEPAPAAADPTTADPEGASTLPPPLTGVSADDLPRPVPIGSSRVSTAPVRAAATAAAPRRTDPASVLASLKLDGIVFDKRDPVAMINGRMVRPGALMGSARVVKILADSVIVRIDGAEYSLGQ